MPRGTLAFPERWSTRFNLAALQLAGPYTYFDDRASEWCVATISVSGVELIRPRWPRGRQGGETRTRTGRITRRVGLSAKHKGGMALGCRNLARFSFPTAASFYLQLGKTRRHRRDGSSLDEKPRGGAKL